MENIRIYCENDGKYHSFPAGTTLKEISDSLCSEVTDRHGTAFPVLAALVDHRLKELEFRPVMPHKIEFIGYNHPDGRRTYIRSLCFVLQNAVRRLFPDKVLCIDYALPSGLYCEIRESACSDEGKPLIRFVTDEEIMKLRDEMQSIIDRDLPFRKMKISGEEAEKSFLANGQKDKALLVRSLGRYIYSAYTLDGNTDTFYGPLLPSTSYLQYFDLIGFSNGFCLRYPTEGNKGKLLPMKRQSLIAAALKEHSDWCHVIGIRGVGTLNEAILHGHAGDLINLSEARHERIYADIADMIYSRRGAVRIVFIAGPSSSGKTSTSLRLAIQCRVLGLNPKVIELDNYFVDREKTPRDENGNYDFEALEAMDLDLLNSQLNSLLNGERVEIPKFSFKEGRRHFEGNFMQLAENDILIMEGIHALNPAMTSAVDNSRIFRVYASALTSLSLDENNNISTSDNRMLRRMIRDNRVRGISPEDTILRWQSVRRGEDRNIFPFQENADAIFNSAHIFELPVLKYYAEPLLRRIAPNSQAFTEATRMLKFLDYIVALSPDEISGIPPTSILREFIGGQTL